MDTTLEDFFNSWSGHDHYSTLQVQPKKFKEWKSNPKIKYEYYNWIEKESNCPSLRLDIEVPYKEMEEESRSLLAEFVKHRGEEHPGWKSLVIHGVDKHTTDDWTSRAYSFSEKPDYVWTEIADRCPKTKHWLENVWSYSRFDRVRFMLLEPGGFIRPHKDFEIRKLAAYNIAINNPEGVEFVMEDAGLIPWKQGDARAIDIGRLHSVRHRGEEPRIHMIIHGAPNDQHIETVCRSYDLLLEKLNG